MTGEIAIGGVFIPSLLVLAVLAALLTMALVRLLDFVGLYRFVAYRALVDLCLFVLVLAAISFLAPHVGFFP